MAKGKKTGGRDFKPGVVANPNGRGKTDPEVKEALQANLERRFGINGEALIDRLDKTGQKWDNSRFATVALQANLKLFEYIAGKVTDKHELTGKDGAPLSPLGVIPTAVLRERVRELLDKFPTA